MRLRAMSAVYRFRESLFLLPFLVVSGGVVLALITNAIDDRAGSLHAPAYTLRMNSNAATWLLSTVAGATITTAGVVFSLTVVSLQLASSQFSPRVMRSFIRDRLSQMVIGLLVATFVYCVLTLPQISGNATDPAPPVSLTVAVALTVVTVVAIVAHLDHLARRLQVGQVVRDVAAEGEAVIAAVTAGAGREQPVDDAEMMPPPDALQVLAARDGWVSQVDTRLLLAAVPAGTTVRLETRVGAYIHEGEPLVAVWPRPKRPDHCRRRLAGAIEVSHARTMQQDVDFAFRQLVDIALRALSSAINDPSTAVEVTLRIGSLLRRVLLLPSPPRAVAGSDGRVLVRPWDLDPGEYIEHGFAQLRHAAPPQPQVAAAILRLLRMLTAHVKRAGRTEWVPALQKQVDLLMESLAKAPDLHPEDLAELRAMTTDATDPADHSRKPL